VGYISDRIGTKTVFLIALALFTIGSALCAFAPNAHMLIAFRVMQGVGGGALMPVAIASCCFGVLFSNPSSLIIE
jgi:MFS family permease